MSNQQNNEVFVIECPMDAVLFMIFLERHLYTLANAANSDPDDLPERIYHQMVVDPSEAEVMAYEAKRTWLQTNKPELIRRLHHNMLELDGF